MQRGWWDHLSSRLIGTAQRGRGSADVAVNIVVCLRIRSQVHLKDLIPFICPFFFSSQRKHKIQVTSRRLSCTQRSDVSCEVWESVLFGVHIPKGADGHVFQINVRSFTDLPPSIQLGHGCMEDPSWVLQWKSGWAEEDGELLYVGPSVFSLGWIQPAEVDESELNHSTAEGLQRSL